MAYFLFLVVAVATSGNYIFTEHTQVIFSYFAENKLKKLA